MSSARRARVALIVNPIAGMGGRVGLKGTDGAAILAQARELGAEPLAAGRADIVERALRECGVEVTRSEPDSAAGTRAAAASASGVASDLILFVGGDGTARDIVAAVGTSAVVLGVPAGVKMHSACFAVSPAASAEAAIAWLASDARRSREAEVVDIDEAAMRADRMDVRLYGMLLVPDVPGRLQSLKASSGGSEEDDVVAVAQEVARRLPDGCRVILGPGTTTRTIGAVLGVATTLLGFDVIEVGPDATGRVLVDDAAEPAILAAIDGRTAFAVISPTGGQGFLLGRGNQQLSPAVLRAIGIERLLVAATPAKLAAVGGRALHVDTGDPALDAELAGYRRVITGPAQETLMRVAAA